jgi:CRP/FNR family transcriptional regulator
MHAYKVHIIEHEPPCASCQAEPFCFLSIFKGEQLRLFKKAVVTKGPMARGEMVYRSGQPFSSIYCIRQGSIKTEVCTTNGVQEVTTFHLVGELLGIDSIGSEHYPADAVALEETCLCELPFIHLQSMCSVSDEFHLALIKHLGRTINRDVYQWALARNLKAKQKVAWFLFDLFKRGRLRQTSDMRIIPLPMRKTDIANYLGLAPESLSRALHVLEKEGVIINHGKAIYLSDIKKVQALSMI